MRPLEGITVVTLEHAIAAPYCTRQLADLGARVIKVERPGVVDFARAYDSRVAGLASHFVWTNRSKESLTLDLKHPEAATVLGKLLASEASWAAADTCLQTHGGFGFAEEYDVERKFRETRLYQVAPISTNLILSYVAEHVLGLPRSF